MRAALLPERDQCKVLFLKIFGSSISTLKLRGTIKREGRQTNIFREREVHLCCHVETSFLLGSWFPFKKLFSIVLEKLTFWEKIDGIM